MTKKAYLVVNDAGETVIGAWNPLAVGIRFTFDDETAQDFLFANVNEETSLHAAAHGFSQKIGDSYAGAAKAESPLAYAKEVVAETIAQMYAGEWKAARAPGEAKISDFAIALARAAGKTPEAAQEFIDGLDDEQKKAWKAKAKVKAELAKVVAEKAAERAKKLAAKVSAAEAAESDDTEEEEVSF